MKGGTSLHKTFSELKLILVFKGLRCERWIFVNNSTSMPQMGHLISPLFKSPCPIWPRPLLGSRDLLHVFGIRSLDTFTERWLLTDV